MDHNKKLEFLHKIAKLGMEHTALPEIQHFDSGGTVLQGSGPNAGNTSPTTGSGVMGGVTNVLGLNNNFQAQSANVTPGTNTAQLNKAYSGAQSGIDQQQGITNTLTPGVAQGAGVESQLQSSLADEAAGKGPNAAQSMLSQQTGQNVANQAALMAGQRGASSNPGLMAREAAQQGAATQQQAVGQGATLQAQQTIAAQQQQANLANAQIQQGRGAVTDTNQVNQNEQQIVQGANTAANNAGVSMQSNINTTDAGVSAGNQNAASNVLGGVTKALSSVIPVFAHGGMVKMDKGGNVLDAEARKHIAPHNFALPNGRYPIHDEAHARNALARVSQNGTPEEKSKVRAAVHKKYPNIGKKMASGGEVKQQPELFSDEWTRNAINNVKGMVNPAPAPSPSPSPSASPGPTPTPRPQNLAIGGNVLSVNPYQQAPQSAVAQFIQAQQQPGPNIGPAMNLPQNQTNFSDVVGDIQKTRGEDAAAKDKAKADAADDDFLSVVADEVGQTQNKFKGGLAAKGGNVKAGKGEKATVEGDSLKNDKIPTMLSEGEVVIDRDTMADQGPIGHMARALAKHIEQRNKRGKK